MSVHSDSSAMEVTEETEEERQKKTAEEEARRKEQIIAELQSGKMVDEVIRDHSKVSAGLGLEDVSVFDENGGLSGEDEEDEVAGTSDSRVAVVIRARHE